jgi:dolichol kinase
MTTASLDLTAPLSGREVALELHGLLRDLDPARFRADGHLSLAERAGRIRERAATAREAFARELREKLVESGARERLGAIANRLAEVARFIEEHMPRREAAANEVGPGWQKLRERLVPTYEALAAGLREYRVHLPSLRPTNYARNLFHITWGLSVMLCIETWLTEPRQRWIAGTTFIWAWAMEFFRRRSPWLNETLMKGFGKFAHPHEWHRINSGTWYITALLILAWFSPIMISAVAVGILALADPSAAIIGRRFGRTKLVNGRSLEGSLTFAAVGTGVGLAVLMGIHGLPFGSALTISLAAAVPAAVAELFSGRIDDNFTIPLTAALGGGVALHLLAS